MVAQVDLMRLPEIRHQAGLMAHMVHTEVAEHAVPLRHTDQQAQCHPVDRQDHTNHLLQAVVHQVDLLAVEFEHLVRHEHIVAHTDQPVPTVQCHLAVLPHGNWHCGLIVEVAP